MKNSKKNKETMISENFEKSLGDWKLPPSSVSDIFEPRDSFSCFPDCSVKTVEKEIPLQKEFATFPLFSSFRKRVHQICYGYVHIGMIQVGLKPTKLGSKTSAIIFLRDKRFIDPAASVVGMVKSSLSDGPIYFSYFPTHCVALADSCCSFTIDVKIKGSGVMRGGKLDATLMYRFHYRVVKWPYLMDFSSRFPVDKRGKTTSYLTNIAQSNRVVSKTISWDQSGTGEGLVVDENELASSGEVGNANVDWKETVKVDVPGFKKEEVKVEVEDGRILRISGERGNEHEEEVDKKPEVKEKKEKISERISALQQLVLPFGKTDTASVLLEAMEYIRYLHEQVQVSSAPYLYSAPTQLQGAEGSSLSARGLCVVPVSFTFGVASSNGADIWAPIKTSPTASKRAISDEASVITQS